MLVGVWLGLHWVLFYFFDHYIQSSVLCCAVLCCAVLADNEGPDGAQDCKPSTLNFHILPLAWLFPLTNSNMGAAWR